MNPMPIAAVRSLEALQDVLAVEESFGFRTVALWASSRADTPNFAAFRLAEAEERRPTRDTLVLERVADPRQLGGLVEARAASGWVLSLYAMVSIAGSPVGVALFHRRPKAT